MWNPRLSVFLVFLALLQLSSSKVTAQMGDFPTSSSQKLNFLDTSPALNSAVPTQVASPDPQRSPSATLDQVNNARWDKAWTNLVNDAQQSFVPSMPRLSSVEVELVVGNPGQSEDTLTLTLLGPGGKPLASVSKIVKDSNCAHALFDFANGGIEVTPGTHYSVQLTGSTHFGWKYVVGGYKKGAASFNGRPLLPDTRSTFLFRTYGTN